MNSAAFIDWLSYTVPNTGSTFPARTPFTGCSVTVVDEFCRSIETANNGWGAYAPVKPNAPFGYAQQHTETGARIEWGGGSDRVLVSYPGKACFALTLSGKMRDVLRLHSGGCTRIDVTLDMVTETAPRDFVAKRNKDRHKNGAVMFSETGETVYVGSWSSDRFARVYRYFPPHPRAEYLRAEHVFKGKQAKALCAQLVQTAPKNLMANIGEIYGWAHSDWVQSLQDVKDRVEVAWHKDERRQSKTLKWLEETCLPAIARLVREGEIVHLEEWLEEHLYAKMQPSADEQHIETARSEE